VNVPLVGISLAAHTIPVVVTPFEVVESIAVTEVEFTYVVVFQKNERAVPLAIVVAIELYPIVMLFASTVSTTAGFPPALVGTLVPVTDMPTTINLAAGVVMLITLAPAGELDVVVTPTGVAVPAGTVIVIVLLVTEFTA
jgi:hypothetical protein